MIFGLDREWAPLYGLGWKPHRRVHFRYDNTHPVGGSHHQKIVVIDDRVAFCGGIDLTCRRWDTCAHARRDAQRVRQGAPYPPFHDLMMAVEGDAARALGDLVRERWRKATGETLHRRRRERRLTRAGRRRALTSPWPGSLHANVAIVQRRASRAPSPQRTAERRARSRGAVPRHDRGRAALHLHREPVLHRRQAWRCAGGAPGRARRPRNHRRAARAEPWLARRAHHADAAHAPDREAAAADAHDRLPRVLSVHRRAEGGHLHRRALQDDRSSTTRSCASARPISRIARWVSTRNAISRSRRVVATTCRARSAALRPRCSPSISVSTPEEVQEIVAQGGSLRGAIDRLQREDRTLKPLDDATAASEARAQHGQRRRSGEAGERSPTWCERFDAALTRHAGMAAAVRWGKLAAIVACRRRPRRRCGSSRRSPRYLDGRSRSRAGRATSAMHGGRRCSPSSRYTPAALVMFPRPLITLFAVVAFGPLARLRLRDDRHRSAAVDHVLCSGTRLDRSTVRRLARARS